LDLPRPRVSGITLGGVVVPLRCDIVPCGDPRRDLHCRCSYAAGQSKMLPYAQLNVIKRNHVSFRTDGTLSNSISISHNLSKQIQVERMQNEHICSYTRDTSFAFSSFYVVLSLVFLLSLFPFTPCLFVSRTSKRQTHQSNDRRWEEKQRYKQIAKKKHTPPPSPSVDDNYNCTKEIYSIINLTITRKLIATIPSPWKIDRPMTSPGGPNQIT